MRTYQQYQARSPEEDAEHAMQFALRVLNYRQRTEVEMRQRLERKGYSALVTDRTLATLTRLRLLDDREFVSCWVRTHTGHGRARLKQELLQKGIPRDVAEEMISTGISADEEFIYAVAVAKRALRGKALPLDRATLGRLQRLLQRRGFSFALINRVCAGLDEHLTVDGDWLE